MGVRQCALFLIPILHQTTTVAGSSPAAFCCFSFQFYIKPQHIERRGPHGVGCFSFQFYIKPQLNAPRRKSIIVVSHSNSTSNHNFSTKLSRTLLVVSHSNSTSNHNLYGGENIEDIVVSHSNSTSNHNGCRFESCCILLFLIPILHQTTTLDIVQRLSYGCFSFQFYIKPQHIERRGPHGVGCFSFQFYIKPQLGYLEQRYG